MGSTTSLTKSRCLSPGPSHNPTLRPTTTSSSSVTWGLHTSLVLHPYRLETRIYEPINSSYTHRETRLNDLPVQTDYLAILVRINNLVKDPRHLDTVVEVRQSVTHTKTGILLHDQTPTSNSNHPHPTPLVVPQELYGL